MQKHLSGIASYLGLALGLTFGATSWAQTPAPAPTAIKWTPESCSVTLRVDGITGATGWGSHFSISEVEDGNGGYYPECHLFADAKSEQVRVSCHDGILDGEHHVNHFHLPLGAREDVDYVELSVGRRGVQVRAQKRARSSLAEEAVPYHIDAFFPMWEETGFCSGGMLFIQENGVLDGKSKRKGSGYKVSVRVP